ncbi:hypothetical protein ACOSQ2_014722 [Xanthoceras sorbifolium]
MQLRDGVSCNSLISGLAQSGYSDRALELFEKMQLDCLKPDRVTVASLLIACASAGALHKEEQLHSYAIKVGMSKGIIIEGSLLGLYMLRDGVSYNSLISGLAQSGYSDRALELFEKLQLDCLKPDCVTIATSKAAVETMVKVLAKELKGTDGGCGTPVVRFLATDASVWVNGHVIRVHGDYV